MELITFPIGDRGAYATGYLHTPSDELSRPAARPCVVVCPGGGYQRVSDRENEPVASALFAAGYQVFVLNYSTGEKARDAQPLRELATLVGTLRTNAQANRIDPRRVAVMGFSAGGHLAASLATHWQDGALTASLPGAPAGLRPDALILCYPVITAGPHAHAGSIDTLCGDSAQERDRFSLENHVTADTPPTFLWHTADDASVPVENTLLFVDALRRAGVPFEAHVFAHGRHGLSMCSAEVGTAGEAAAPWFGLLLAWLKDAFAFDI